MATARQTTEIIDGEDCSVHVVKTGVTTWMAYGDFRGKHISQTGRSDSQALDAWRRAANYQNARKASPLMARMDSADGGAGIAF